MDSLEKDLQGQLDITLYQEECLWFQKSRSQWITDGDRNTKYYHSKKIIRRRKNKILSLRDGTGNWVDGPESLKAFVRQFYIDLFIEDKVDREHVVAWNTYPNSLESQHDRLSAPIQLLECKKALFKMGPLKSPREDGYPAFFFPTMLGHCG